MMKLKLLDAKKLNILLICGAALLLSAVIGAIVLTSFGNKFEVNNYSDKLSDNMTVAKILNSQSEIRAVWIATVGNINFPSSPSLDSEQLKREIDDILTTMTDNGLNTVAFQVRPSSDSFYKSRIFPSSEFLCGAQGAEFPNGTDIFEYLITEAHKLGIAVCAWVNPLRVTSSMNSASKQNDLSLLSDKNPAVVHPEWCVTYDSQLYYNPGLPEVRNLVSEGVKEIAENYDADAIVFDDYFYPYPKEGAVYDDSEAFEKYGNGASLEDWRRQNINLMIEQSYKAVKEADVNCFFGISPFGIWQNDDGSNGGSETHGLSAYSAIYCDAKAWINGGYIDFISPQIYWNFDSSAAPFAELADWWDKALEGSGIPLIISHAAYRASEWNIDGEITRQVEYSRGKKSYLGSAMYGYASIKSNDSGVSDCLHELY